jgi:DNA mismatch repair protein MutS
MDLQVMLLKHLTKHFQTVSLKVLVEELKKVSLLQEQYLYLSETQHNKVYNTFKRIAEDAYVWMDRFTIRNLELYRYNPNYFTGCYR